MLTVQEAERAIRGLDTPLDVIQGACIAILYPSRSEGLDPDTGDVVKELLMGLRQRFATPSRVCEVIWTAAAWQGVSSSVEGREVEMFREMQRYIADEYKNVLMQKMERLMKKDPERGVEMMMRLLQACQSQTGASLRGAASPHHSKGSAV